MEALIASQGRKILAHLLYKWVDASDESAVSDFLRVSPLSAEEINISVSEFGLRELLQRAFLEKLTPIAYVSFDDLLTGKEQDTHALESVDIHHDHHASRKVASTEILHHSI